jgi:CheY-like chemotaxis protein
VLAARNAFAALGYLETSRFSVILSDLSMPQMDGRSRTNAADCPPEGRRLVSAVRAIER